MEINGDTALYGWVKVVRPRPAPRQVGWLGFEWMCTRDRRQGLSGWLPTGEYVPPQPASPPGQSEYRARPMTYAQFLRGEWDAAVSDPALEATRAVNPALAAQNLAGNEPRNTYMLRVAQTEARQRLREALTRPPDPETLRQPQPEPEPTRRALREETQRLGEIRQDGGWWDVD